MTYNDYKQIRVFWGPPFKETSALKTNGGLNNLQTEVRVCKLISSLESRLYGPTESHK